MGRNPCCSKEGLNRGAWTAHEDKMLTDYIKAHGEGRWRNLPKKAGLKRCGKSCRLRWLNYLRPDIKRGNISPDEEELIIRLHKLLGNRWSLIAGRLPGRTDNEIKNYWNTNLGKKVQDLQNSAPTRNHSNQSSEKNSKKPKTEMTPKKASPSSPSKTESHLFRTKALKCSKDVIINPQPHKVEQNNNNIHTEAGVASIDGDVDLLMDKQEESNQYNAITSFANGENNPLPSTMDFNVGELCLSDLLNCNLSDIGVFNYSNNNSTDLSSPSDDQPLMFSEEMLQDWTLSDYVQPNVPSNLHSFAPFLDSGGEWLGE